MCGIGHGRGEIILGGMEQRHAQRYEVTRRDMRALGSSAHGLGGGRGEGEGTGGVMVGLMREAK